MEKCGKRECLEGSAFHDLSLSGEKCCFYEIYGNAEELEHSQCLSSSQAQIEYTKYLEFLLPSADNESFKVVIKFGEGLIFEEEIQKTPDENELCNLKKKTFFKKSM